MRWPSWARAATETRANATDRLVALIQSEAGGTLSGDARAIAALETASKLYEQAFAAAHVIAPEELQHLLTPRLMSMAARALIRRGEIVFAIEADPATGIALLPCGSWDIAGGPDERSWFYRVDMMAPSGSTSRTIQSAGVVHMRWGTTPGCPWKGVGPLGAGGASTTGSLAGALELRLAEEIAQPVGSFLPLPRADATDPDADTDDDAALRADIRAAAGKQLFVESTVAGWGEGMGSAPRRDWVPSRFGAQPPEVLNLLRSKVSQDVLSSCGIPIGMIENSDGTAMRESLRRFVMTSCQGLAALMATEIGAKIAPIEIDFSPLHGHDLSGRTQSYARLTDEKLSAADAREVCGI